MSKKHKKQVKGCSRKYLKRVPLDLDPDFYEATREAARAAGESINGFIKRAILETAESDRKKH